MMLRSQSKNVQDPRHKRKQNEQFEFVKNPTEPVPKKQQSKGLSEIQAHISGFQIDSAKRQQTVVKSKENDENIQPNVQNNVANEDKIQLLVDPTDPCPYYDYDKEEANNPDSVPEYANGIMKYYKSREAYFRVTPYMENHPEINPRTRAILVDWLVEMQESFELNHETLYNAVKVIDLYLSKTTNITKEKLQKLACAAVFISAKYDERSPPLADDLVYLAGDRFSREDLMEMERELFSTIDFDLGSPLSYRYLRRLGRVCRVDMSSLTLSRYILETSLLIYDYALISGSRLSAAAFLLAMKMKDRSYEWNPILEKYSGYTKDDILPLMEHLNHTMHFVNNSWGQLANIREKYSHEVFFQSALVPFLPDTLNCGNVIPKLPNLDFP